MLSALLALTLFLTLDRERATALAATVEMRKGFATAPPEMSEGWTGVRSGGHAGRPPVTKDESGSPRTAGGGGGVDKNGFNFSDLKDVPSSRGATFLGRKRFTPSLKQNLFSALGRSNQISSLISKSADNSGVRQGGLSRLFRRVLSSSRASTKFLPADESETDSSLRQLSKRDSSAIQTDCGPLTSSRCQLMPARTCMTVCVDGYNVRVCRRRNGCSIIRH